MARDAVFKDTVPLCVGSWIICGGDEGVSFVWVIFFYEQEWGYGVSFIPAKYDLHLLGLLWERGTENLPVWHAHRRWVMTHQRNSIMAFSPDGVSLTVEAFSWSGPNYWAHNPEVLVSNSEHDQSPPFSLFWSGFSLVLGRMPEVTLKGPWTDFARDHWQCKAVAQPLNSVCGLRKIPV